MRQARRAPSLAAALGRAELFSGLPPRAPERIAEHAEVKRVVAGGYLFRAGDTSDCLYVVRAGRLKVVLDGTTRPLAPGDAVGELAAITGAARSAAVVAVRDSELVAVSPPAGPARSAGGSTPAGHGRSTG